MRNLYKKISVLVLAGLLLVGCSLPSVSIAHAGSSNMLIRYQLKKQEKKHRYEKNFKNEYYKIIDKIVDKSSFKRYEELGDRFDKEARKLNVNFSFAALPSYEVKDFFNKEVKKFEFDDPDYLVKFNYQDYSFVSPDDVVHYMAKNRSSYSYIPFLVRIDGFDNNIYEFIVQIR